MATLAGAAASVAGAARNARQFDASWAALDPGSVTRGPLLRGCHDCGLINRIDLPRDETQYRCTRCSATLITLDSQGNQRALAYTVAALILLILANAFPLVSIDMQGNDNSTSIAGAVLALWRNDAMPLALLVFATTMLVPALELVALLYVLIPTANGRPRDLAAAVLRLLELLQPWGMISVFMLGLLTSLVKLGGYAQIVIGVSLYSLAGLLVVTTLLEVAFRPDTLWQRMPLDRRLLDGQADHLALIDGCDADITAAALADGASADRAAVSAPAVVSLAAATDIAAAHPSLMTCHVCKLLLHRRQSEAPEELFCPRCHSTLHHRKPASVSRTIALLSAAVILYFPANLLPITQTGSILGSQSDTILSGVVFFWQSGSWPLALLVFFASIMVPLLKMIGLSLLALTAARRSQWQPMQRTKLYRLIEFVGRWSMLDIYVIAIMTTLVQISPLATIDPGPAAVAFGSVVVLTMLSSMQFDPRLIWDPFGGRDGVTA